MSVYNEISNKFFDECDAQLEKSNKIKKISMLSSAGSLALFALVQTIADKTGSDVLSYIAFFAFIATIAGLIVMKIFRKKIKNAIKELEGKYYDDVYMQIVAKELNATANSTTYINTAFKKDAANIGDVLESRDVEIAGFYKGCPYKITTNTETVVNEITYNKKTKKVLSYIPLVVDGHFNCNYSTKRNVESDITISSPMMRGTLLSSIFESKKRVKMDNKRFKFEVGCEDPVAAYKFLTADVMEEIMALDNFATIDGMLITAQEMNVMTSKQIINLHYSPSFGKNMKKNREKYSGDSIFGEASSTADKIKEYLSYSPAALISYQN